MEAATPRPDVLERVRYVLPEFSPDEDSRAWCSVAALVRSIGRSSEETRQISYDDLALLFDVHGPRWRMEQCDLDSLVKEIVSGVARTVRDKTPSAQRGKSKGLSVDQRLKQFCEAAPKFCIEKDLEEIAQVLNCGVSSFYGGEFFEKAFRPCREKKSRRAPPQEAFRSEETAAERAMRAHEAEIERVDEGLDARG